MPQLAHDYSLTDHHGPEIILTAALSVFMAQVLKVILYFIWRKPVNFRLLVQTGGMPSSHSAMVIGLATSVGLNVGFSSVAFAIALGLAVVVMYDAAGVRRAAGNMASILNRLTADLYHNHPDKLPARMRELLGHTPVEVIGGALLGVVIAIFLKNS